MYRRPKFLQVLHAIREQMSREVDYDVDLFAEMVRSTRPAPGPPFYLNGNKRRAQRRGDGGSAAPRGRGKGRRAKALSDRGRNV